MTPRRIALALLAALASSWVAVAAMAAPDASQMGELTDEARTAVNELHQQIAGELAREYAISGTLRSIVVCKYTAPELTSALSRRYGAQVRRVTLRVRNPSLGTADRWEQTQLLEFERRVGRGEALSALEVAEFVDEPAGRYFRYLKAIVAGTLCVSCHGPVASMTAATRARLASEYPHDRATGYRAGDMLGAISFKKPLPETPP